MVNLNLARQRQPCGQSNFNRLPKKKVNSSSSKFEIQHVLWDELPGFSQEVIYYSNVSDFKWENNYNGLINISTNFLARQDLEDVTERFRKGEGKKLPHLW